MTTAMDGFNDTIHPPRRLFICSFLATVDEAEFGTLRDAAGISDSSLSKHLSALSGAGYVRIRKPTERGRVRTWVALTAEGRRAFEKHRQALRRLLRG
ncbi:winged helix-turn-helix domain-containing protein [Arthrobacter sp. A2-55]|uniref:winged helix-turn-helix domain-containing protein n=1 Tax=Arthrobacter sp. A2-55 TaxID=2897337 RepID=UPI0021CD9982|nr:transcriptional regulator [Arthrobacter sp. A2-55]MCU6481785.1 transcriptional regulator [Arthrobacter sp. A2-55]